MAEGRFAWSRARTQGAGHRAAGVRAAPGRQQRSRSAVRAWLRVPADREEPCRSRGPDRSDDCRTRPRRTDASLARDALQSVSESSSSAPVMTDSAWREYSNIPAPRCAPELKLAKPSEV